MEQRCVQWMQSMDYSYETWTHMDEIYDEIYDLSIEHFVVVFILSCFTRGFLSQSSGDMANFDLENLNHKSHMAVEGTLQIEIHGSG